MKLDRKLEIAKQAVLSISRHDDEAYATVKAVLGQLQDFIAHERGEIKVRKNETVFRRLARAWRAF